tara:strand:- start:1660 stop:2325 length:666 start_codon:yes stop_codon:yes gene_type:complete
MNKLVFYGADVCPFAYRVRLALAEKNINHEYVPIDLQAIPPWFHEISPTNKVPLLKHGRNFVWESTVINEFLEDVYPEPHLLPRDPVDRAHARIWIEYCNKTFQPNFCGLVFEADEAKQKEIKVALCMSLEYINKELGERETGPYWLGENISLVDLTFYPFLEQFVVLDHYRDFKLPASLSHLKAWVAVMQSRPSVRKNAQDPAFYIDAYECYMDSNANKQ